MRATSTWKKSYEEKLSCKKDGHAANPSSHDERKMIHGGQVEDEADNVSVLSKGQDMYRNYVGGGNNKPAAGLNPEKSGIALAMQGLMKAIRACHSLGWSSISFACLSVRMTAVPKLEDSLKWNL
ncbi:hypothetical protein V6N13_046850 [Hibiscus sabdariffa]